MAPCTAERAQALVMPFASSSPPEHQIVSQGRQNGPFSSATFCEADHLAAVSRKLLWNSSKPDQRLVRQVS
eukprot:367541-Amphidinium_carterae.1